MKKLPQLSLRDLFWLVALVALGCAWWVDRGQLSETLKNQATTYSSIKAVLEFRGVKVTENGKGGVLLDWKGFD